MSQRLAGSSARTGSGGSGPARRVRATGGRLRRVPWLGMLPQRFPARGDITSEHQRHRRPPGQQRLHAAPEELQGFARLAVINSTSTWQWAQKRVPGASREV